MKTMYIPKGQAVNYDTLETEHLVVYGVLNVAHRLKARTISGSGLILAGTVSADNICVREVEAASVYCLRLAAKRVQAAEVFASESAAISCYLCADYVAAGRLTVALHDVGKIDAREVISLPPKKVHPFWMLLASVLRLFQGLPAVFRAAFHADEVMDAEYRQAREEPLTAKPKEPRDEELERFTAIFRLLRSSGYTLKIIPGTPEENAPTLNIEAEKIRKTAA